ncbi:hypothetical protein [Parapusillimonas granuli]|uniref:hypothetical protein n=1 Tax=Parapusillimonas granuli TaxID=380911 RepID=UPI00182D2A9E|nr:hypothetical protein [Parapusillimonas granuli]
MARIVLICLMAVLAAGCSPSYNWREMSVAGGAVRAIFPDKPATVERELEFQGRQVAFSMTSASVGGGMFTVAYAALPGSATADASARVAFAQAVMRSLYRNLGAAEPEPLPAFGETFVIEGKSSKGALRLKGRVWLTDQALVEGLVTAVPDDFPGPEADEFLKGVAVGR